MDERRNLNVVFGFDHFGNLGQDWEFGQSLEDHVRAGDSDGRVFHFVQQDWHQNFLDFFGHDVFQLTHGQNCFGSDHGRVFAFTVEDDLFQFEDAQVQTSVAQSFQVGQAFFPFVGLFQFANQQLDVFFFQMARAELFVLLFHFDCQQVFDVFFDVLGPEQFVGGLFHFAGPQFFGFAFQFASPLAVAVGAQAVHQRSDGQPD